MQLKLPKQLLDWIMTEKGDLSPQSFIIDKLFLIKETTIENEGVEYENKEQKKKYYHIIMYRYQQRCYFTKM